VILAIDPGDKQSAYVFMDEDYKPVEFGKVDNFQMMGIVDDTGTDKVVIEMVASYGMAVGAEVFETVYWIGRFYQIAHKRCPTERMLRRDVKLNLCHNARAKDSNIIQALKDRFGDKGTKKAPGWFYGFKADCWQAYALAVTYADQAKEGRAQ
jgi:sulfur relay (sulfurtransferase) DsrC/TusE family protein